MSEAIQLVPNKWVSEEVLMAITGLTKNAIKSAWEKSWMEDREYRHYSGDCQPKNNSPSSTTATKWITGSNVSGRRAIYLLCSQTDSFNYAEQFPQSPNLSRFGFLRLSATVGEIVDRWLELKRVELTLNAFRRYKSYVKICVDILGREK
jgi:hypothetical protein